MIAGQLLGYILLANVLRFSESVLCEVGEALRDPNNLDVDRQCNVASGLNCPGNYVCVTSSVTSLGSVCCPSKQAVCALPPQTGANCGVLVQCQRWYYNPNLGSCQPFNYNGCFGNLNNFYTKVECELSCRPGQGQLQLCPAGSSPFPGATVGTTCSPYTGCANGYTCTQSTNGQFYCCTGGTVPNVQICPVGTSPAPGVTVSIVCAPVGAVCQAGYVCQTSPNNGQNYCCTQPQLQICPNGCSPAPGVTLNTPCSGVCPGGYSCVRSPLNNGYSYCCSGTSTAVLLCPNGWSPQPGISVNTPCGGTCAAGYTCQRANNGYSYCCMQNGQVNANAVCPAGGSPVMVAGTTNKAVACVINGQPQCPSPYTCQSTNVMVNGAMIGICCQATVGSIQICPAGYQPYRPAGQIIRCANNGVYITNACAGVAQCIYCQTQNAYVCCVYTGRSLQIGTKHNNESTLSVDLTTMTTTTKVPLTSGGRKKTTTTP